MASNPDNVSWLPGAQLNIAESALTGRDPDAPALIWATEEAPETLHTLSLGTLCAQAMHFAASLHAAGFLPGKPLLR
jgi:acyl-coenzyme A synthetase/AMP-(fatty) acid ligase